jgi:hypothetical protein
MNISKKASPLIAIFVLLLSGVSHGSQAAEPSKKPKPPCRIQISHAHISDWILKNKGFRAVKVDAFSRCNIPQSRVTLTVEIWKKGAFGKIEVARSVVKSPGVTYPGRDVENFRTWRRCKSLKVTEYYGVAYAKAFIQGKWQIASDTYSLEIEPLACGT